MVKATDRFYNMQVSLLKDGRVYTEKVAITNVWQKDSGTFLGFYFHNVEKSLIYDSAFVRDIWDLNCDKIYADVDEFIADFYSNTNTEGEKNKQSKTDEGVLSSVKNDVVILLFMARGLEYTNIIKEKIIFSYIQNRVKAASSFSEQYLHNFIKGLKVSQKDFYMALKQLKSKKPKDAEFLLKEIVKLCLSDGQIHYNERMYLADIVQTLRLEGLRIPKNLF